MEHLESAKANSDALPVVIGISIEEDDLDDLHTESPRSPKVGTLVDQFSYRGNGSQSYSRSSSTGGMSPIDILRGFYGFWETW